MSQAQSVFLVGCVLLQILGCLQYWRPAANGWKRRLQPSVEREDRMRDGIKLSASIYLPKLGETGAAGRTPMIVTLTPYLRHTWEPWASYFASHGYAFASIDVRGRGDSEGDFEPYVNEAHDDYDIVEWLARQPFCDGQVGM